MPVTDHAIVQTLANEVGAMRELRSLLKEEQAHLIAADIEALSKLTEIKASVVARISDLSARRDSALAALGINATADAIESGLSSLEPQALGFWTELMAIGADAKEMNRTNGLLVARQMANNQNALQALLVSSPASSFYGPNGQSRVGKSGTSFVSA